MVELLNLDHIGETWRVTTTLTGDMDLDLVIPKPYFAGPSDISGHSTVDRRYHIVILGAAVNFYGDAKAVTRLVARDNWIDFTNNAVTATNDDIFYWASPAADVSMEQSVNCLISLAPGGYRYGASPATGRNGSSLAVITDANVVGGGLTVWGIHTQYPFARQSETSSPVTY